MITRRIFRHTAFTVALLATATTTAAAGDQRDTDRAYGMIEAERAYQRALIEQGRRDGSLTWLEKLSLQRQQARVDKLERDALADGHLSTHEVRAIRRAQADTAASISAERQDGQVRGWWWRMWR